MIEQTTYEPASAAHLLSTVKANGKRPILPWFQGDDASSRMSRFWRKVAIAGPNDCWDWTAGGSSWGYGCFKIARGFTALAHRISLVIATQREPDGFQVLHSCNRPVCCNPKHLRWGTHQENVNDRWGYAKSGLPVATASVPEEQTGAYVGTFAQGRGSGVHPLRTREAFRAVTS